jgi:phosphatidylglycerophosphate synthase
MAAVFVISFHKNLGLFYVCVGACVAALVTDLLDGYFARRLNVASVYGRQWDSLGDKSFYVGIIIAFNAQGFLGAVVSWALIVREVALYITRVLFVEKLPKIEDIRPWTNWHGYFMYALIILGLLRMYAEITARQFRISGLMMIAACAALVSGVGSIFSFLRLDVKPSQ